MKLKSILFIALLFILGTSQASASTFSARPSAVLISSRQEIVEDNRVKILKIFLKSYNSPMADSADTFIEEADKYGLDWRLVAAIAGLESGYGHHIPTASYNGWGWGVYGDNVIYFTSWDDGIRTISQGIRERYINQRGARNIYEIGATYAASPTWAQRVEQNMSRIGSYSVINPSESLSISL